MSGFCLISIIGRVRFGFFFVGVKILNIDHSRIYVTYNEVGKSGEDITRKLLSECFCI